MSGHTPGPWVVVPSFDRLGPLSEVGIAADFNGTQCEIAAVYEDGPESDADARLIASAPDLLAACTDALEAGNDGDWQSARRTLESVIAKATGEQP